MKHSDMQRGFGIYIHWPFCQSKCPYCDFNSHVSSGIDQGRWKSTYLAELDRVGEDTSERLVNSVYFGGGTPSLMDPDLVAAILDKIKTLWRRSNDVEVTLEANPSSVETDRFTGYREGGVNRVSIGVQALDEADLLRLGRVHSVKEAYQAIEIGNRVFDRVNLDLIYARQDQSLTSWTTELKTALNLGTSHMSLYQLTVEDGTVFQQRQVRGLLRGLPSEDLGADMYDLTQDLCGEAGMPAYEVSNHARVGDESQHNLIYWRGGDYVGIGPGAHGRLMLRTGRVATEAIRQPTQWLEAVETQGSGEKPRVVLTAEESGAEYLMMGMRIKEGVSMARYAGLTGRSLDSETLDNLLSLNLIAVEADRLCVTGSGVLVLNAILRDLLAR